MTQNMAVTTLSLLAGGTDHLGAGAIGLLGAVTGLTVASVALFLSRHVPHHRAAGSAAAGMVALSASLVVISLASSFEALLAGTVVLGFAGGVVMPGLLNAIVSGAEGDRERVIGLYTVTLSVALAVGPFLETLVLTGAHQDVRVPYLAFAGLPLVGAALAALAGRRHRSPTAATTTPQTTGGAPLADADVAGDAAVAGGDAGGEAARGGSSGRRWQRGLLASASGRTALVAQLLYAVPFAGVTVFGALVAQRAFGLTPAEAQLGFTVFFALSLGARATIAWRAPIVHKRALLWLSAACTLAGLVLLGTGRGEGALLVAMGILGVPHGLTFPLALALVADATPLARLPRANATLIGSTNLTSVVVPLVLGAVVPVIGYRGMTLAMLVPVAGFGLLQLGLGRPARAGAGAT